MAPPIGLLVDNASIALFVALAVYVARATPRSRASAAFVAYVIALALGVVSINVFWSAPTGPLAAPVAYASAAAWLAVAAAAAWLARTFPWPLDAQERARTARLDAAAAFASTLLFVASVATTLRDRDNVFADASLPASLHDEYLLLALGSLAFIHVSVYLGALLALRFAAAPADERTLRGQTALAASALLLFPLLIASISALGAEDAGRRWTSALGIALVAAAWLRATHVAPAGARLARNVAWLSLGVALAGLAARAAWGFEGAVNSGLMGVGRILGVLLLAYAIVRYHLLDIDVKIRWTISRGTLAAAFVAVFFVVSETAQELFSLTTGSGLLGIVAAGMLVFALAPLQRAAERIAERALPPETTAAERREAAYRATLRRFLADGVITHEEERVLATLAAELDINAARAFTLREEVQAAAPQPPTDDVIQS